VAGKCCRAVNESLTISGLKLPDVEKGCERIMRIEGPNRLAGVVSSGTTRRASGTSSFTLEETEERSQAGATSSAPALTGLDALLALQSIDADKPRKRKRAFKRGHDLLDRLDEIKIGLLSGELSGEAMENIVGLLDEMEPTGDDRLDALVADIALRAEVELAKLGRYRP
jgi:hypothetical protein